MLYYCFVVLSSLCIVVLMYCCIVVMLYCCFVILSSSRIVVLMYCRIVVIFLLFFWLCCHLSLKNNMVYDVVGGVGSLQRIYISVIP